MSKVEDVVIFEGDLVALTTKGKVYRLNSEKLFHAWPRWIKIGEKIQHIVVSKLSDGKEVLSMGSGSSYN